VTPFEGNAQTMDDAGFFALMASMIELCGKFISSRLSYIIHDFIKASTCWSIAW
jgi:hypothetical protein